MKERTLYTIDKDGFQVDEICHVGQWGTHVDPPAHFHKGLKTVDQIDPKDMLMQLVVLDVHRQVAHNPDYVVSVDDVKSWEEPSRPHPGTRIRRSAYRLVSSVAQRLRHAE
jgi:kynurenine formamidase